jgi:hypothetical protein
VTAHKVIGVFAYLPGGKVVCDGNSCIIAGSEGKMKKYISLQGPQSDIHKITIKKTRFGEIKKGMELGGAYSFDEEAYNRFYPIAQKHGIKIGPEDFTDNPEKGLHFVRIERTILSGN